MTYVIICISFFLFVNVRNIYYILLMFLGKQLWFYFAFFFPSLMIFSCTIILSVCFLILFLFLKVEALLKCHLSFIISAPNSIFSKCNFIHTDRLCCIVSSFGSSYSSLDTSLNCKLLRSMFICLLRVFNLFCCLWLLVWFHYDQSIYFVWAKVL